MKLIITIILFIVFTNASAQNSAIDCKSFLQGTFKYVERKGPTIKIKGKRQVETYNGGFVKAKISWADSCTYRLTVKKVTVPNSVIKQGDVIIMYILKIEDNVVEYKSEYKNNYTEQKFYKVISD